MIQATANYLAANTAEAKQLIFLIEIQNYARTFVMMPTIAGVYSAPLLPGQYAWVESIDDLGITVADLDGGADFSQPFTFSVQDHLLAITAEFPNFTFEGKKVFLKQGFVGLAQPDFTTLFVGKIDSVESGSSSSSSDSSNNSYLFSSSDIRSDLNKVIYLTGDDGQATSSDHPRTIVGHPLDILIAVLKNEVGYADEDIDLTKIELYRDTVYSGLQFKFTITSPPAAKDFLENEICKELGAYIRSNNLGQITVNFFQPIDATPVMDLNPDILLSAPLAEQSDLVNQVVFRFDYPQGGGDPLSNSVQQDAPSQTKYGLFGEQIIESNGMRAGLQGFFLSQLTSRLIFSRYGNKGLKFGDANDMPSSWKAALLEPGDFVTLSHPKVPDRSAGVMGISGLLCEVMDRIWHFSTGTVSLKLLAISSPCKFAEYFIAPDCTPDFTAASPEQQAKYMFLCGDDDKYSDGEAGHVLA